MFHALKLHELDNFQNIKRQIILSQLFLKILNSEHMTILWLLLPIPKAGGGKWVCGCSCMNITWGFRKKSKGCNRRCSTLVWITPRYWSCQPPPLQECSSRMKIIWDLIKCSSKREKVHLKMKINSAAPSPLASSKIAYAERKAAQLERSYCSSFRFCSWTSHWYWSYIY